MDCIVYKKKQQTINDGTVEENNNNDEGEWEEFEELFLDPVDSNDVQTFPAEIESNETIQPCTALRIEFGRSTDFYGRIVIYSLEVWGGRGTE